jgi:DNA-3-methyladenine glycosylase
MRASLDREFFAGDTLAVARRLLGCTLAFDGCEGTIVETEGYKTDAASHFATRRIKGRPLAETFGQVYIYLNYGMYYLLNFTTERRGVGAVLIRAVEPTRGMEKMKERRGTGDLRCLTSGPGKLCVAFGITGAQNGEDVGKTIRLYPRKRVPAIGTSTRIGIRRAADLPWRFFVQDNPFVSRP